MLRVDTVPQIPGWRSPHESLLLSISLKRCSILLELGVLSFPWLLRMCPSGKVMFPSDDVPVRIYTRTGPFAREVPVWRYVLSKLLTWSISCHIYYDNDDNTMSIM
ncbi:hypothetical protein Tco_1300027, partial [Tanacetum coccineum]